MDWEREAKEKSYNYKKKINRMKHISPYQKSEEEAVSPFFPQRKKRFPGTSLNMVSQLNST